MGCLLVAWGPAPHRLVPVPTWGRLLVVRGPGPEVAGVASGEAFVGGLGGGVAHSSWAPTGLLASFQRFPAPGGGGEQDECATRAPLHIHPGSQAQADGRIRMIPPFTDRGL